MTHRETTHLPPTISTQLPKLKWFSSSLSLPLASLLTFLSLIFLKGKLIIYKHNMCVCMCALERESQLKMPCFFLCLSPRSSGDLELCLGYISSKRARHRRVCVRMCPRMFKNHETEQDSKSGMKEGPEHKSPFSVKISTKD